MSGEGEGGGRGGGVPRRARGAARGGGEGGGVTGVRDAVTGKGRPASGFHSRGGTRRHRVKGAPRGLSLQGE